MSSTMAFTPIARVLPPEEWAEKAGELAAFNPEHSIIVVVEDGANGPLLARWGATTAVHVEGLEILPEAQGHAGVAGALLREMVTQMLAMGVLEVLTQATTPQVEHMIESAGGRPLPGNAWVIPLAEGRG